MYNMYNMCNIYKMYKLYLNKSYLYYVKMYDINFKVKYKTIEEELLQKVENGEKDYDKDDVLIIVENLYKHELLAVLHVDDIGDNSLDSIISELWNKMKLNSKFTEVVYIYKDKFPSIFNGDDELGFSGMFCYNLFYLLHECICQQFTKNEIDESIIQLLKKQVESL